MTLPVSIPMSASPPNPTTVIAKLIKDRLFPDWQAENARLERIDRWYRWTQDDIKLPRKATTELRALAELSKVPWLHLVVTACAQAMYVDGYRSELDLSISGDVDPDSPGTQMSPPWRSWMANAMDRRQIAVHRAMLAYGYGFTTALPGQDPVTGAKQSVIRGVSPRKMWAVYEDPAEDDWPVHAIKVKPIKDGAFEVLFLDDESVHRLGVEDDGQKVTHLDAKLHGVGVCPVIRYTNQLDLDGRTPGEVEPFIPLAARINKTAYDRMLTQHFNSWKVRTISGMSEPDDDEDANRRKLQLRQDDLLVAEDTDTKFGSLDETSLGGFIDAHRADVETLAAVSQTPTHELTGQMANLSADALAAARASLNQKVTEREKSAGASHAQTLRLSSAIDHHEDYATDMTGRVTWQDMEIRSMSQAADALGKMVQMLGVPPTATWQRIPGVEKSDVAEWIRLLEDGDPVNKLKEVLNRQMQAAENAGAEPPSDEEHPPPDVAAPRG